ncbi:spherulation-specific family 4 protein [Streptomyces sp.]|uniref:spherulation-specific family 4 protein n=1 Tax=Streptomyces sp. TaxID=1931 RepID=UPI002F412976
MNGTATPQAARPGLLLVPLYVHPAVDPAAWRALEAAAPRLYAVVLNAADGPGVRPDPAFATAARRLRGAGVRLLGYVDTAYAVRSARAVHRDLRRHRAWYATDGVFFDRVASDPRRVPYYRRLSRAARIRGARTVVLNPGVHPDPAYARLADLLVTFEGSWADYLDAVIPPWTSGHPPARFCHLVYAVPRGLDERVARTAAMRGAAVHCAVPGTPPNPWRSAP